MSLGWLVIKAVFDYKLLHDKLFFLISQINKIDVILSRLYSNVSRGRWMCYMSKYVLATADTFWSTKEKIRSESYYEICIKELI